MAKRKRIKYADDYNPILEYCNKIESGEEVTSRKVEIVYKELKRIFYDDTSEYEYNNKKANHALEFIENYCKHSKGKFGGKPFIMELWQKAIVAALFGFVHKIDETRKFREVILVVARKNGKSTLASAISLYLMIADGEPGAEIYSVATKKDQAKIIWSEAKRMVRKSPQLLRKIKTLVSEMVSDFNDSVMKPLSSDSDTLDGLNVHGAFLDEIHAWKDMNLYDVVVDGNSSREQPITFITTTAGTVRESVYDSKYEEGTQIIRGFEEGRTIDEHVLPIFYELNNRDDWKDESHWKEANPGLGTIKKNETLRAKVNKAKRDEKLLKNLLCKDFNIRETSIEAWLSFDDLYNPAKHNISEMKPSYGIAGADLSQTTDLTCATILFKVKNDPTIYVDQMYFLPEDILEDKIDQDGVPYDIWYDLGLLRLTPGNRVDYKEVTKWYKELMEEGIYIFDGGYDNWSASYWVDEMKEYFGKETLKPVPQTKKILSGPMHNLAADLKANKINYNDNPILKYCMSNTSVDRDKNDNIQPVKGRRTTRRIDGLASLLDAYVAYENCKEEYENLIS